MVQHFTHDIILDLVIFQSVVLLIVLGNVCVLGRSTRCAAPSRFPPVSILVPARNEEANIERCVRSLLLQDYLCFEVLVLDDGSTDATPGIVARMAADEERLDVVTGAALPTGWIGKNWACAQLAARAEGELLFFTDADTVHAPGALRALVTAASGRSADLLTGFPRQELGTWGERLIIPFFAWALLCFVPLSLAYWLRLPALSGAVGQIMLFRREAYQAIGGHESVRESIAEDLSLARRIKRHGFRWRMMDATRVVSCRMYRTTREAYDGLTKNLFAAFNCRLLPYLFVWVWLLLVFVLPIVNLGLFLAGVARGVPAFLVLVCIGLSLALWLIPYGRLRVPLHLALLYPLNVLVVELVALRSLWQTLTGRLAWKDRRLDRPCWRLI